MLKNYYYYEKNNAIDMFHEQIFYRVNKKHAINEPIAQTEKIIMLIFSHIFTHSNTFAKILKCKVCRIFSKKTIVHGSTNPNLCIYNRIAFE